MTNQNSAPMDFDPSADYLAEARGAESISDFTPAETNLDPVVGTEEAQKSAIEEKVQIAALESAISETLGGGRQNEKVLTEQEKKDAAFVVERSYEGGYKDVDDINSLFDKLNLTPEQRRSALIDGIVSKITVGRSYPAPEISHIMKSFGLEKRDFFGTRVQAAAIEYLDSAIERELARGASGQGHIEDGDVELVRTVLDDNVVDSRIRNLFDARKVK